MVTVMMITEKLFWFEGEDSSVFSESIFSSCAEAFKYLRSCQRTGLVSNFSVFRNSDGVVLAQDR